jgi:hypothetical protein
LQRRGRPENQTFDGTEPLYKAIKSEYILHKNGSSTIKPSAIDVPNCGVNRGEYSNPEDVLLSSNCTPTNCNIITFSVGDIRQVNGDGNSFRLDVSHIPQEENYAYSEIVAHSLSTGQEVNVSSSRTDLKTVQRLIAKRATLIS